MCYLCLHITVGKCERSLSYMSDFNSHANVSLHLGRHISRAVLGAARARGAREARVCARAPLTTLQPQPWRPSPSLFLLSLFVGRRRGFPFLFVLFTENRCCFSDTYLCIPPLLVGRRLLFYSPQKHMQTKPNEELRANMTERKDPRLTVRLHIRRFL